MTEITETKLGTCYSMCPEKERLLREKEGLLHEFEIDESTKNNKRPKADPAKTVKSFCRPAAGRYMIDPQELRPAPVLMMTIRYLFTKIVTKTDCDWVVIYDFVFDRLRAIRQDIVIQRLDMLSSICLLERIVRFHVYSAERLCERNIYNFDQKLNMQHLLECIKQLLVFYDEYEQNYTEKDLNINKKTKEVVYSYTRSESEALYVLVHLGEVEGLKRGLSLSLTLRQTKEVQLSLKISFAWYLKNYVRAFRLIQNLSPLLMCAALCYLRNVRRSALCIMSSGYNSKNLMFPGQKLQELLLYKSIENLKSDCQLFGLVMQDENVQFQKLNFKDSIELANPEMIFTDRELHDFLPTILLE